MYNKLIVALDSSASADKVLQRALEFAAGDTEKIELVHVVETLSTVYGIESVALDLRAINKQLLAKSEEELIEIGKKYKIPEAKVHVVLGKVAVEIRELAEELKADAIVMGSHGHSGWKLMLGSTANKVLHGAKCDVLTIHVDD